MDMKLPKREVEKTTKAAQPVESEQWPYGLQLRFESEQVDKLPQLQTMEIGERVLISGVGEVTSISKSERKSGSNDWTVQVQLKKIGVDTVDKKSESLGDAMKRHQKGE